MEQEAEQFAISFLMPGKQFKDKLYEYSNDYDVCNVTGVSNELKIPTWVINVRGVQLGFFN